MTQSSPRRDGARPCNRSGESFGAASCTFYEHDRENSPGAGTDVGGARGVFRPLGPQPGPRSRPARRTVPSKMYVVHKGGLDLSARTRPLDGGRAQDAAFLPGDGATGEAGVVCGVLFLGRWRRLVLADLSRRRPVYARRRDTASPGSDPTSAKSSVWPRKFAAFDAASKLSALERVSSAAVVIDATGRATQMNLPAQNLLGADFNLVRGRPAAHDPASNRRLQQLVSFALHAERRRRSVLCADRRRSR